MFSHVIRSPYIDIFELFAKCRWANAHAQGDIQQVIDKTIGKRVFQINGSASAANFLALPRNGLPPLALNGRVLYLQLCVHVDRKYVFHVDLITDKK